jgi:hypothetical protein
MIERYLEWCHSLEPGWLGYALIFVAGYAAAVTFVAVATFVVVVTNGWALLAIPAGIVYLFYLAIFCQGGGNG